MDDDDEEGGWAAVDGTVVAAAAAAAARLPRIRRSAQVFIRRQSAYTTASISRRVFSFNFFALWLPLCRSSAC